MKRMNRAWTCRILLRSGIIILLSFISGCLEKTQIITPVELPTTDTTPEVGKINEDNFFVLPIFDIPGTPYYIHEQKDFDTKCQISKSETDLTKKDLYCILDAQELDLYHTKLKLNFNAPQNVCSWVRVKPFWFYDYEPSPGPIVRQMTVKITATAKTPSDVTDLSGNIVTDATPNFDLSGANCSYDYSKTILGAPNCCEGKLLLTTEDKSVTPNTTTLTEIDFGGKVSNCVAGPGKDYQVNQQNFPSTKDFFAEQGINSTLDLPAMDSSGKQRSGLIYLANFFRPADYGNAGGTFSTSTTTTFPRGMRGPDVLGSYPAGFPYYEFDCRDRANDLIARIRLLIRGWDKLVDFENKNPYVPANPGTEPQFGETWHDMPNWTDINPDQTSNSYPKGR